MLQRVTKDLTKLRTAIANVCFVGEPGAANGKWVLVDAGVPGSAGSILMAAERLFGARSEPAAIVLTHGHFDHVGALKTLLRKWDVPVYAHELELPYLRGESPYPPPDPSVGGGMMARMAPLYPRRPIDVSANLRKLPKGGEIPPLPGWRWIHTPGHTSGHVSLFRESDRALIAGDAVITVNQESALDVLRQRPEISGPPAYFTQDWQQSRISLERIEGLMPNILITGHGQALSGEGVRNGISRLLADYDHEVVPSQGRYVGRPVMADEHGLVRVPPKKGSNPLPGLLALTAVSAVAAALLISRDGRRQGSRRRPGDERGSGRRNDQRTVETGVLHDKNFMSERIP